MNIAVVLSGGVGTRLGSDIPKQYLLIQNRPLIAYSLDVFLQLEEIDAIQIVADQAWRDYILNYYKGDKLHQSFQNKFKGFSNPGQNRQLSILHALEDIAAYATKEDCVIIHDAARPCLQKADLLKYLGALDGHDGVLPVLPMKDTVYYSENGQTVTSLLDRNKLFAGQAPELFRFGSYYHANQVLSPEQIIKINGSTEPAILAGLDVAMVPGDEGNYKITTKADIERFRSMMEEN